NDKARQRAIVIHAAKYAEESFIRKYGRLGRSFGCPALPARNYEEIIELIKGGTLLFIYFPQSGYLENSSVLN
ncbi:MAG: murein L,D-transpeptidase catalytic domain family protein, partial [Bacteroidales bacterium]|nr:murein L,D-transpeptidase catalytic domain family protein [Bacteroidales bacterium]